MSLAASLSVNDHFLMPYTVAPGHTVADILPEAPEFQTLPDVFTTGCLLAIMEWACIRHLTPHLDEGFISLGAGMDMTHDAPCTTGTDLVISCRVAEVQARKVVWDVEVRSAKGLPGSGNHQASNLADADGIVMGRGRHTRAIVPREKFSAHVNQLAAQLGGQQLNNP